MLYDGKDGRNKDETRKVGNKSLADNFDALARPIVTVDVKKYESWLDDPDLSEEQKEEFLQALWSIVVTFVELGFGVHPLQEVCGQNSESASQRPKEVFGNVRSKELDETEKDRDSSPAGGLEVE
jgi:hypothetical protein